MFAKYATSIRKDVQKGGAGSERRWGQPPLARNLMHHYAANIARTGLLVFDL